MLLMEIRTARQRQAVCAVMLTEVQGSFTLEELATASYPFRSRKQKGAARSYDSWLQGIKMSSGPNGSIHEYLVRIDEEHWKAKEGL